MPDALPLFNFRIHLQISSEVKLSFNMSYYDYPMSALATYASNKNLLQRSNTLIIGNNLKYNSLLLDLRYTYLCMFKC